MLNRVHIDNNKTENCLSPSIGKINFKEVDFSTLLNKKNENKELSFERVALEPLFNRKEEIEEEEQDLNNLAVIMGKVYELLLAAKFQEASLLLEKAVFIDLESNLPQAILKCSTFWQEKQRVMVGLKGEKQSDFLTEGYRKFEELVLKKLTVDIDRAVFNIKMAVFNQIIRVLEEELQQDFNSNLCLKLGRAYKKKGDYDRAIDVYRMALRDQKEDVCLLAELADCYAIIDEEEKARVLFREAFYYNSEKIDFDYLESAMILNLKAKVEALPYEKEYLKSWMAVYGVVDGLFGLSRELRPIEYTQLNQAIYTLRLDLEEKGDRLGYLKPQLIYKLFWLIDYHKSLVSDAKVSEEIIKRSLVELRFLDEKIYKQYII